MYLRFFRYTIFFSCFPAGSGVLAQVRIAESQILSAAGAAAAAAASGTYTYIRIYNVLYMSAAIITTLQDRIGLFLNIFQIYLYNGI